MNLVTSKFRETIEQLINELKPSDFIDAEEKRLAAEFQALPLGIAFGAILS